MEPWRKLLSELSQELERQSAELRRLRGEEPLPKQQEDPKYMLDTSWSLSLSKPPSQGKDASTAIASWISAASEAASSAGSAKFEHRETQEISLLAERNGFTVMQAQKTKRFVQQKPWYVINPDTSAVGNVWQGVVAAALLFVAFVTPPVQVGLFELQLDGGFALSLAVDMIFALDMILQFFTTYPRETPDGIIWVVEVQTIAVHYMKTWFVLDFITVVPFDLLVILANGASELKSIKVLRALRLLKLMRLLKTSRLIHNLEIPLSIPYQKVALVRFLVVLMLVCHWVACFWAMALNLGDQLGPSWIDGIEDPQNREPLRIYIAAFYFACYTITSVGFGDITPKNVLERSMCSAILLVSGLAWAYILGEVGAIVSDMTSESQEFRRRMHHLNVMMQEKSLPSSLRKRLRSFFLQNRHHWVHRTRQRLLESMSPQLQNDVCMKTHLHWLRKVMVFEVFMRWIESKEAMGIYTGGFYACVADMTRQLATAAFAQQEIFANMQVLYILSKGLVMLNKKVGAYGEVWGEDFVLSDTSLIRPNAGTALTYIEVHYLTREALFDVIERHQQTCPQLQKIVRRYCVRLAVYRGIVAEARRRAGLMQKQKAMRPLRETAQVPVMEVPPEIPPTPQHLEPVVAEELNGLNVPGALSN